MQEAKGNPTIPKHTAQTYKKPTFYYFFSNKKGSKRSNKYCFPTMLYQCRRWKYNRAKGGKLPLVLTVKLSVINSYY